MQNDNLVPPKLGYVLLMAMVCDISCQRHLTFKINNNDVLEATQPVSYH